jgi:hypothetical protein
LETDDEDPPLRPHSFLTGHRKIAVGFRFGQRLEREFEAMVTIQALNR